VLERMNTYSRRITGSARLTEKRNNYDDILARTCDLNLVVLAREY